MRTLLFLLSFFIFPFNLLFYRAFFPKQTVPTIRIQHEYSLRVRGSVTLTL